MDAVFEANGKRERLKVLRVEPAEGAGEPGTLLDDHRVACGQGAVKLIEVQRAGKQPMDMATLSSMARDSNQAMRFAFDAAQTAFYGFPTRLGERPEQEKNL
jgi:methionyl-tRNA formyltransferase